jgi:uncharacterized membrane protein
VGCWEAGWAPVFLIDLVSRCFLAKMAGGTVFVSAGIFLDDTKRI